MAHRYSVVIQGKEHPVQLIDEKTGEFGGFNTPAKQAGNFMRVIYESMTEIHDLDILVNLYSNRIMYVSMDYKGDLFHMRLVAFSVKRSKSKDFIAAYHFIALAIDAEKQLKGGGVRNEN